ncbi:MAG: M23 family metallopeptidase [Ardenticatenales bacterium]|nr:M23 family metallopeptidase [Ardenticatenales bacterium]
MSDFAFAYWPTEFRSITQSFGVNEAFYRRFGLPGHEGIDFMGPEGSKLFAVADGTVVQIQRTIGEKMANPYGLHLTLAHADGYQTIYAHLSRIDVRMNQQVKAGQVIGLSGNTGNSLGAHLHLTLKKQGTFMPPWPNNIIDPTPFVLPLLGFTEPVGPFTKGYAYTPAITVYGNLAQANAGGISLRKGPSQNHQRIEVVPEGTMMRVTGGGEGDYTPVEVPNAAIGKPTEPRKPAMLPDLPPTVATVDGWGWTEYMRVEGNLAVTGQYGINLRAAPAKMGAAMGVVRGGATVQVMGDPVAEYTPVRVSRMDFVGPINMPEAAPDFTMGASFASSGDVFVGWAWSNYLKVMGNQAEVGQYGVNLRNRPDRTGAKIGVVKGFASVTIAGDNRGEYTPIMAHFEDMLEITNENLEIEQPSRPGGGPPEPAPEPMQDSTPGWAFSGAIDRQGDYALAGRWGINLRDAPRRDGANVGFVPAGVRMLVTGNPTGEYTPIRVEDSQLQKPFGSAGSSAGASSSATTPPPVTTPAPPPASLPILGKARIGLHASADPDISETEHREFGTLRPAIIKVLSHHSAADIGRLAQAHPGASFIVRAFLSFGQQGERNISAGQFVNDTIGDVTRALGQLGGRDVVIELHNEPNLVVEGWGNSWATAAAFNSWWLSVLREYRRRLPNQRYIFPGLSPGGGIDRIRHEHTSFIEACRPAINESDGLGVHIYWANNFPMSQALGQLDDYLRRYPNEPIWVTEASNNKGGVSPADKGREYLRFWQELQRRPTVQGVTYFVASSRFAFADEVWVHDGQSHGIGAVVGAR